MNSTSQPKMTLKIVIFGLIVFFLIGLVGGLLIKGPVMQKGEPAEPPKAPTSLPFGSVADIDYLSQTNPIIVSMSDSMDDFATLNSRAANNPSLILDRGWLDKINSTMDNLQFCADELIDIKPVPPKFAEAHNWTIMFATETRVFVSEYRQGIEQIDADIITRSYEHLDLMIEYLNEVNLALAAVK